MEDRETNALVQAPPEQYMIEDNEDPSLAAVLSLPGYDSVSDQKVLKSVKDIFKGFEYSASGIRFEDADQLAAYTQTTMDDIKRVNRASEASSLCHKAAAMARFWYLGDTIDKALADGDYGSGAVGKLASYLHKSIPYIYQIRAVASKLGVVDCYLLGMRGLDSTHLRKLAQVKDDRMRRGIIDAYVNMFQDTSDRARIDQARKQLVTALNAAQTANAIAVSTSDPLNGGSDVEVSEAYTKTMDALAAWSRLLKKVAADGPIEELVRVLADFYIQDSVPDAQERLDAMQDKASELLAAMRTARANLDTGIRELESFGGVEVMTSDEAAV